jgi:hypothetical protein
VVNRKSRSAKGMESKKVERKMILLLSRKIAISFENLKLVCLLEVNRGGGGFTDIVSQVPVIAKNSSYSGFE